MASNLGAVVQTVGASWLMTSLEPRPDAVALVQTAALTPMMLLSLPAGALADTADRRKIMLFSQIFGLVAAAGLAGLAARGVIAPGTLLLFTFLIGCATALHQPAWQASIGDLVARDHIPAAVALNSLAFNMARSLGPAVGGVVLALAGAPLAFAINAVSFLGLIVVLLRWRRVREAPALPPEPIGAAILSGLRYVALSPRLKSVLTRGFLFGFGGSALWALMPLIARERLHGGPMQYGLLLASFGAGSMAGALTSTRLRARWGGGGLVAGASTVFAVATLGIGGSTWLTVSMICALAAGAAWIWALGTLSVSIQMSAPRWVVGRAVSMNQVSTVGGLAVGAAFWGSIAHHTSLGAAYAMAAGVLALSVAVGRLLPLPETDALDLTPGRVSGALPMAAAIDGRTGPVIITIEYRVPADRAEDFLAAAHTLGAVRRRDGAPRWRITQDMDNLEIWREQFESPTWMHHLRRASRLTVADQALRDLAQSFDVGDGPIVRRMVERPPGASPLG